MPLSLLSSPMLTQQLAEHLTVLELTGKPLSQSELDAVCCLERLTSLKMRLWCMPRPEAVLHPQMHALGDV